MPSDATCSTNGWDFSAVYQAGPPPKSKPPAPFPHPHKRAVLLHGSPEYAACLKKSYRGFVHDRAGAFPEKLHVAAEEALEEMTRRKLFHYDVVSAGNSVSSTFCERTLLGDEGMTYHYQKLRIFAYPWGKCNLPW